MLSVRSTVSLVFTKFVQKSLRLIGYHGSSLPGLIMEKLSPSFMDEVARKNKSKIIIITGTNGKSTTTQIITSLLKQQHKKVISNYSGSNFTRGINSTLITNYKLSGGLKTDFIVLEVDEAYSPGLAKIFKPDILVALNILRDQLDRYGEINKTAEYVCKAADYSKLAIVNAHDSLLVNITTKHKQKKLFFGATTEISNNINNESNLFEQKNSQVDNNKKYDAKLTAYKKDNLNQTATFSVNVDEETFNNIKWRIIGEHNALNATAAILAVKQFLPLLNQHDVSDTLNTMPALYGRSEIVLFKKHHLIFNLVKNPSGFNQIINSHLRSSDPKTIAMFINDEYADSRDVSWLWDVDFKSFTHNNHKIFVGGLRKYDMALCLRYQDIECDIIDSDNLDTQLNVVIGASEAKDILILPTYTAMLKLRQYVAKQSGEKHIW